MDKTLIIYDNTGYVIQQITGSYRVPTGVPYLEVEIPEGKQVKSGVGVDVLVTPNQAILEDIPLTEVDALRQQVTELQDALVEIADIVAGGAV